MRPKADSPRSVALPRVTVVISVYNEARNLPAKLDNCREIDYPPEKLEILFGSDGSTDGSVALIESASIARTRVISFAERRGKAPVLNDLIRETEGEIIVFSDANTTFRTDTVRSLVRHFEQPDVGAVCGSLTLRSDDRTAGGFGESAYWKYENLLKLLESQIETTVGATGGVYAIRKSLFKPLPTKTSVPDDFVLPMNVLRNRSRIVYDPEAVAFEDLSNSVLGEFQRKVRIGTSAFYSIRELTDLLRPGNGFAAFALWSRKIIRWFVPILLILTFLSSGILAQDSRFFSITFVLQVAFYGSAFIGFLMEKSGIRLGFLGLPYYFTAMNLALLIGFVRFLGGKQTFTWEVIR